MSINTYSGFTYGHTITDENKYLQFNEGSGEITVEMPIGSYTLGSFVNQLAESLNSGGSLEYSASVDRNTRIITISANGSFSLLVSSGSLALLSAFNLAGFTSDKLSGTSFDGDIASGDFFEPQFLLQSYIGFENSKKTIQANVNQSASGEVEIVSYGRVRFMECNITLQTNIKQGAGSILRTDLSGEDNLRDFLDYATTKAPMEFIPDSSNPSLVIDCLLESTQESGQGVDYKVKELYTRGLANYYESGLLVFRELV